MQRFIKNWGIYLLKRMGSLLVALLAISLVTFVITRLAGTPAYLMVGDDYTKEMLDSVNARLGLDKPLHIQYIQYLLGLLRGDLGVSRFTFNPVTVDIAQRLPATLELALLAILMMMIWGVPAGTLAAIKEGSKLDRAILVIPRIGVSAAQFWLGLLLIYVLYYQLDVFPAPSGRLPFNFPFPAKITGLLTVDSLLAGDGEAFIEALRHLLLPAFTLAFTISPGTLLVTRSTIRNILRTDYIRTARSFGIPKRQLYFKYVLRNAMPPILTVLALAFGSFIGGTVLVEVVFSWPGIGRYAVDALSRSDFEPIVGLVLLSSVAYAVIYLITDIMCAILDPRYKLS